MPNKVPQLEWAVQCALNCTLAIASRQGISIPCTSPLLSVSGSDLSLQRSTFRHCKLGFFFSFLVFVSEFSHLGCHLEIQPSVCIRLVCLHRCILLFQDGLFTWAHSIMPWALVPLQSGTMMNKVAVNICAYICV